MNESSGDPFLGSYLDLLDDADDLALEVKLVAIIVRAAAGGDVAAGIYLAERWSALAGLLDEVLAALTTRN